MKIIDGIKEKGHPFEIPDCGRQDLPEFFQEMGYKTGVEVGVYKGDYMEKFGDSGIQMYGIDPWMAYDDFDLENENRKKRQEFLYNSTKTKLAKYSNISLIRKISMDAVKDFEDESIDFVYIDGNHKFKYVAEDIYEWSKKVKVGGVVCGHDYIHPRRVNRWNNMHVLFVVDAYIKTFRINNWYLLGRRDSVEGELRDRFRSWLWIKQA